MMIRKIILFSILFFPSITNITLAQEAISYNLTGQVFDAESNYPLVGATLLILEHNNLSTTTLVDGSFSIENIPTGRIGLQISYIGYQTQVIDNVLLMAGKDMQVDIALEESIAALGEVVVTAQQNTNDALNEFVTASNHSLRMEEVIRYSGTLGDVARMAQNFAGVSGSSDDRNDIIVRGNSPYTILWRIEGVDIPSPNHWASLGTSGGPVSLLNTNNLRTSDFISGAFPAEYGNSTGAVFDLKLRNGNHNKYEFLGQIGFNGFELGAEGPLPFGQNASFLINYRYSTLGLVNKLGLDFGTGFAVPQYQDVNFKINIPTHKNGKFSFWGLAGISDILFEAEPDGQNLYTEGDENLQSGTDSYILGFNHLYFFNKKTSSSLSLLGTYSNQKTTIEELTPFGPQPLTFDQTFLSDNRQNKYAINWALNYKVNTQHRIKIGAVYELYALEVIDSILIDNSFWFSELDFSGKTSLARAFVHWRYKISNKLALNTGIHSMTFLLNNSFSIEPRISLNYELSPSSHLSVAYGRHSQLQPLPIYFSKDDDATIEENTRNEALDFLKSDHFVLSYKKQFKNGFSIKSEAYYQRLRDIATDPDDLNFSILNFGADFGFPNRVGLVNEGKGENYGIELTINQKLTKGFYFLWTNSLFQSTYRGENNQQKNTYYNSNVATNFLIGKEFRINKKLTFQLNARFSYSGGRRYTPINLEASIAADEEVRFEEKSFESQLAPYIRPDLKIGLIYNSQKNVTQSFSVDFQNFIGRENELFKSYDENDQRIRTNRQRGFFPDVRYQILF